MAKNVLIVEDKTVAAEALEKIVKEIDENINVFWAKNKENAYMQAMETDIDLFLIDVVLDTSKVYDVAGMKFAEKIRRVDDYKFTPIIIVTSLEDPKLYAYSEIHCYSYIEKPYDVERTKNIIRQALEYRKEKNKNKRYMYKKQGVFYTVNLEEIIYVESISRNVTLYTVNGEISIPYISFEKLLKEFNSDDFIRCSKYCLVNKNYVEGVDMVNRYLKLRNIPVLIEIGISLKKKVLSELRYG